MFKNKTFLNGLLWLVITGIVTYKGLSIATDHNVFVYGAWAGVALANSVLRFYNAYKNKTKEKGKDV